MRTFGFLIALALVAVAGAQDESVAAKRYNVELDAVSYPQDSPRAALESVLKAIAKQRIEYVLAQLADPRFVDERVFLYSGGKATKSPKEVQPSAQEGFEQLVKETATRLGSDPGTLKDLARFVRDGEWEEKDTTATVKHKDLKERQVFFRRIGSRWFMENRVK